MNHSELIIDSFAGGGGASLGIAWAIGRAPDVAINHDAAAIAMHEANHPSTVHVLEDVWRADLRSLTGGKEVGLLWASPDCKHFSRAKGGKPVEKRIRSLAWIVCRWAAQVKPRIIALENVREFADWGPLVPRLRCEHCGWKGTEGQAVLMRIRSKCPSCDSKRLKVTDEMVPCPDRKGVTFKRWVGRLRNLGYKVEWRNLDAADYGAPTHRKRLFLVARCDGQPIEWPQPTHGKWLKPYRTAAECIDWSIECPSIFDRKRPLAEKTMRRIALGIKRYVLDNPDPFIVDVAHGDGANRGKGCYPISQPLGSVTAGGINHALVTPILSRFNGAKSAKDDRCKQMQLPFSTLDTQPRFALIAPTLVTVGHGERAGQEARALDPQNPIGTITSKGHHALCAVFLAKHFGGMVGVDVDTPLPTTTMRGTQNQLVTATLTRQQLTQGTESDAITSSDKPSENRSVGSARGRNGVENCSSNELWKDKTNNPKTSGVQKQERIPQGQCTCGRKTDVGLGSSPCMDCSSRRDSEGHGHQSSGRKSPEQSPFESGNNQSEREHQTFLQNTEPTKAGTKTSSNTRRSDAASKFRNDVREDSEATWDIPNTGFPSHPGDVYSFLIRYFGTAIGQHITQPLFTATGKDRFGLVTVTINGEPYVIVDIGMRMLTPRELARAQGFPDTYILTGTKTSQVARIGNSVCPHVAAAIVRANCVAELEVV